jgi:spermidine synthase/S-adenosylmethionine/arginine decarboxylase-like enzyme
LIQDVKNKGNVSEFAPYIDYLYSRNNNDVPSIPSTWSSLGKELLKTIHGPVLDPKDITDTSFFTTCLNNDSGIDYTKFDEEKRQPFEFAYATALSRSRDDKLVPLLDMFNHHGGDKFNVDSSPVHQQKGDDEDNDMKYTSEYINVYAKRDIRMGEQLYINYMECNDEYLRRHEHHLSKLLRDHGFVEDYPQRWSIPTPSHHSNVEENNIQHEIIFDIIQVDDDDTYEIKWEVPAKVPAHPTIVTHLQKELTRIEDIGSFVTETAGNLTSDHERNSCLKYYQSLMIAYKKAIASVEAAIEPSSPPDGDDDNEVLAAFAGDKFKACDDFEALFEEAGGWYHLEGFRSFHQAIDYYYNDETEDACLFLNEYLHACASNRPHYHEVFVHYPAHFLDKVERVLFIGGGDSMVLHEVLKYNDQLELVVGLELDQQVVRTTFNRIGTQPHFDKHDKVEWWFGDAAQTLNVLPTEYYGTFDLVIVDILSEVADSLEVNNEVTIMEAAMMLMKPNGIIVKNEDEGYVPGSTNSSKFTEHVVDVMYYDVPVYCLQTFVIGSNGIDFSKTKPVDHKVPTLYLKNADEFQPQFDTWYTSGIDEDDCKEKKIDDSSKDSVSTNQPFGMTLIIDADKISGVQLDFISGMQQIISKSLTKIGFTEISAFDQELQDGYTLTFILEEGRVTARCFPKKQYCAIDVQLWKSIHKAELAKKELITAIGCEESSVYRVITSGILGAEENDKNDKIGPPPKTNPRSSSTETCTNQSKDKDSSIKSSFTKRKDPTVDFNNATVHSYDSREALEQYFSQDHIGEQSIVRYSIESWNKKTRKEMAILLTGSLTRPLSFISEQWEKQGDDQIKVKENEIGKGLVITVSWSEGNIVVVWDGDDRVDVNIFSLNNSAGATHGILTEAFRRQFGPPHANDDFPRGTGLIVNFEDEIPPPHELGGKRPIPFWAQK